MRLVSTIPKGGKHMLIIKNCRLMDMVSIDEKIKDIHINKEGEDRGH